MTPPAHGKMIEEYKLPSMRRSVLLFGKNEKSWLELSHVCLKLSRINTAMNQMKLYNCVSVVLEYRREGHVVQVDLKLTTFFFRRWQFFSCGKMKKKCNGSK